MISYSQNGEDLIILNYFGSYKGTLLEVGANDGKTLSNSLAFIERGWKAHLIEPGRKVFGTLQSLHEFNPRVNLYNYAIGEQPGTVKFYESDSHVLVGSDMGLVSSIDYSETERWRNNGVHFDETDVQVNTFADFYKCAGRTTFDFISIDAEGFDWQIIKQIDLTVVGCRVLCIEWNGIHDLKVQLTNYCALHVLKLTHINRENLIFTK